MAYSVKEYYLVGSLITVLLGMYMIPELWDEYLLFFVLQGLFFYIYKDKEFFQLPLFFLFATVLGGYFLRPFVLLNHQEFYRYDYQYPIENFSFIETSLQQALLGTLFVILGFAFVTYLVPNSKLAISKRYSLPFIANKNLIILLLAFLVLFKLYLHLVLGVGLKGIKVTSSFAFLLRFIPTDLPFILVTVYLAKYRKVLSGFQILLLIFIGIGSVLAVLVTGSKTFVLNFGLCLLLYGVYYREKIKILNFLLIAALGFVVIGISLITAVIVKYNFISGDSSIGDFWNLFLLLSEEMDMMTVFAELTSRFNGMDGQILLTQLQNGLNGVDTEGLNNAYSPYIVLLNTIEGIIPGVNLTDAPSCGKSIGYYVIHLDPDGEAFAGALGIYASFRLFTGMSYVKYVLLLLGWGMSMGIYFRLIRRILDPELKFIATFFGCFLLLHVTISGNMDNLISQFVIKTVLLFSYALAIILLREIVRTNSNKKILIQKQSITQ